ncbi:F420H2 dehydrogenase subunit FpoC [Methanolobus halotolerans]|uniref:NADH-quinone oxidoreductase subunit C n=1 Tax=Methanolobus halotolerans TaxID=2052935 RepID=A0A4E0PX55_9EURY|nr:F420H2 dehydrogenase subunit FpoC [Methanolobus halotolerans]TGC10695.1 NADH-quinone oxidoreductase subunit C [Methanolobus halotolerans]
MDANSIIDSLYSQFPDDIYDTDVESDIRVVAKVKSENITNVCRYLKENLSFGHLSCEFGIDYPDRGEIQVLYVIGSYEHPVVLTLKADLPRDDPQIESVVPVYWNANWYERETYELFGVKFIDHPDLKPLVLPEEMLGEWPLRKDYKGFPNKTAKNLV